MSDPVAPDHLSPAAAAWFAEVATEYDLEPSAVKLLTLAAEALDRADEARVLVAANGITYMDRFGAPRLNPAVNVERDSRLAFARLVRELALPLGDEDPEPARPPRLAAAQ